VASRLPGKYIVKQSLRASSFQVFQTMPRKVFTPNNDGVNDEFQIIFENPQDSVISLAKIYDISGAEVSDLKLGLTGDSLLWDGRDRNGDIARGGIYFYQIQVEGKTWSGTIVLAK
jgi:gliding motility-associated-like protein